MTDTLTLNQLKTPPALSAVSDMPGMPTQETVSASTSDQVTETTSDASQVVDAVEAQANATADTTTEDQPLRKGVGKHIDLLEKRARDAERLAQQQAEALERATRTIESLSNKDASNADSDPRPKRADFDDPDEYDEKLIEWSSRLAAKKATEEAEKTIDQRLAQSEQQRSQQAALRTWEQRRAQAIKEMPDWSEVAENPNVHISRAMAQVIARHEMGPKLAYHLGKNPELAEQLSQLDPQDALVEMGVLARDLQQPKQALKQPPEPIKPVGNRSTATGKSASEESMDEYAARRTKQIRDDWLSRRRPTATH